MLLANLLETERKTSGPDALPKSLANSQEGATTSKGNTEVENTKRKQNKQKMFGLDALQKFWQTTHTIAPPPPSNTKVIDTKWKK